MKVPERWLRAWCAPDWTTDELAERLTMAGLEVEEVAAFAPAFSRVVVAEVKAVSAHPDADKLRVCEVDAGTGSILSIVCGAPNVAAGVRVPCALPGAVLPGGLEIRTSRMRGVESQGMLCSARELGISEDHGGLLLLQTDAPPGTDVRAALALDEPVFTLKLTPNLAHCLSVQGVARELSAISGAPLAEPSFEPVEVSIDDRLAVTIEAPDLCGRFSGRIVRGVDPTAPTPAWMRERLERAGQRSISALVDISNYVMLELGRPSHIFDLGRIEGGLTVRWARAGESLELLNGQTIELTPEFGVIADARAVESLAGIMGGQSTAVSDDTRDVYIEAAFWWPASIAGRSRRLGFATDAGHRFERGVDPATTVEHIEYLSRLVLEICGGRAGPIVDQVTAVPEPSTLGLRFERARKVIGVALSDDEIVTALARLGLSPRVSAERVLVEVPSYRFDLRIEEDLIEEVARIHGYERLPLRAPVAAITMRAVEEGRRSVFDVKRDFAARDYQEVVNYGFVDGTLDRMLSGIDSIRLLNPIATNLDVMRTTLWSGLVANLRFNLNRKAARVRLFEVGRVYLADAEQPAGPLQVAGIREPDRLAAIVAGPAVEEQWSEPARLADFFDLKADLLAVAGTEVAHELRFERASHPALHPGRSARILGADGEPMGFLGEMHPRVARSLELPDGVLMLEVALEPLRRRSLPVFVPPSRFPPSIRDIAVVLDAEVSAGEVLSEIRRVRASLASTSIVKDVRLFDQYRGKGLDNKEKSLAFRLWMQDTGRTLEDREATAAVDSIVAALNARFGARLR